MSHIYTLYSLLPLPELAYHGTLIFYEVVLDVFQPFRWHLTWTVDCEGDAIRFGHRGVVAPLEIAFFQAVV